MQEVQEPLNCQADKGVRCPFCRQVLESYLDSPHTSGDLGNESLTGNSPPDSLNWHSLLQFGSFDFLDFNPEPVELPAISGPKKGIEQDGSSDFLDFNPEPVELPSISGPKKGIEQDGSSDFLDLIPEPVELPTISGPKKGIEQDGQFEGAKSLGSHRQPGICAVCNRDAANTVLLSCSHMCCCAVCSQAVKSCPICNNKVSNVIDVQILQIQEMVQVGALDFNPSESQVLIICHHNDKDNTFVFYFLDGQSMAKVVGVGLDYAKIILRNGVDIKVEEIVKSEWESAWFDSKSMENNVYKTMKVTIPMGNDIKPTTVMNQKEDIDIVMARPLIWEVAKYLALQKIVVTLSNTGAGDGGQSSKSGHGEGNESRSSKDTKPTEPSRFPMNFPGRGRENDDEDESVGGVQRGQDQLDDVNGSHANVKVSLLATGYSFKNCSAEFLGVQIGDRPEDLDIKWNLEFDFFRNEEGKRISLTKADIFFGINNSNGLEDDTGELKVDRFGTFHDELQVNFSIVIEEGKPASAVIDKDVRVHGCERVKMSRGIAVAKEKKKGKEHGGRMSLTGGLPGIFQIGFGGDTKYSTSGGDMHTSTTGSKYISTITTGGFHVQEVTGYQKGVMGFRFSASRFRNEDLAQIWNSKTYRDELKEYPEFQGQRVQFSGSWVPRNDEKLAKYRVQAFRYLGEIMRTEVNAPSTSSKRCIPDISRFFPSSKSRKAQSTYDFKRLLYKQMYEKTLYLNHEMTHWANYMLMEEDNGSLTTASHSVCPLVA